MSAIRETIGQSFRSPNITATGTAATQNGVEFATDVHATLGNVDRLTLIYR